MPADLAVEPLGGARGGSDAESVDAALRAMLELYLRHATAGTVVDPAGSSTPDPTSAGVTETGHRLFFLEPSDLECIESESGRQQFESLLPGPHSFALCCGPFDSAEQQAAVERIVETETPAHVTAAVLPIETEFTLGVDTFLGVNSVLRPRSFAMGEAALGEDTVLGPGPTAE